MQEHTAFWYFVHNKVAIIAFMGWFIAQTIKVVIGLIYEKRFNFKWFVGSGGMPSSHAAGVTALATAIGLQEGASSAIFVLALMLAIIVIFDAQGVRRSTGQQAEILNKIMDDIYFRGKIQEDRLKELIGHTPVQVFAGIGVGLAVGFLLFYNI
ncbi:MAG: divergent PAP2 family protein [Candidatus Omnitrophica bacterium]|nr:divergent PAP2 family protein [Candidatus Omnitrophota bacterium]